MAFSHVPLRRTIPAGVLAYLAQYAAAFTLLGSHVETILQSIRIDAQYGGPAALPAFAEPAIPTWKAVGWLLHSAHNVILIAPLPDEGVFVTPNLVARAGGAYQLLFLIPPVVLLAVDYLVAGTSRTYGARSEQFTGASVALGYLPCCVAGALLFSVARPTIAPDVLTSIRYAGLGYPVVFG